MRKRLFALILVLLLLALSGCGIEQIPSNSLEQSEAVVDLTAIPPYSGSAYIAVNHNQPYFRDEEITDISFESYPELDSQGRCGAAIASVGRDLMPTEERGSIGMVKPTGWHSTKYDFVDGKYLYNRCHLIGFQLTGENANVSNLITGTRYLNIEGMLPFENLVADFVKETGFHVMYRVTPIFQGKNLVADGVLMEGLSVEDAGDGVCFCVFAYNVQPGVVIDYATGDSHTAPQSTEIGEEVDYILNTNSYKFHKPDCPGAADIKKENREEFHGTRESLFQQGYEPCKRCNP